jgi:hypothetical protein
MSNIKFAYTSWYNDGVQTSALYRGKRAIELVSDYRKGNYNSSLHYGGDEIVDKYINTVNTWLPVGHSPLTRERLLAPVPARAGKKGF